MAGGRDVTSIAKKQPRPLAPPGVAASRMLVRLCVRLCVRFERASLAHTVSRHARSALAGVPLEPVKDAVVGAGRQVQLDVLEQET